MVSYSDLLAVQIIFTFTHILMATIGIVYVTRINPNRNNYVFPVIMILAAVINLWTGALFSPFTDLLLMEYTFIPFIIFGMSLECRKPVISVVALFLLNIFLGALPLSFMSFFGMWVLIGLPLTASILITHLKFPQNILLCALAIIASLVMIIVRGILDPLFLPYKFLFPWVVVAWIILGATLVGIFLLSKKLPTIVDEDLSKHHGLKFELRRKSVHISMALIGLSVPIGGVAIIYAVNIAYLFDPIYGELMGGIATNPEVAGLVALRFSMIMFLIAFFSLDVIR
ncbi:MAG: hypothetical protein QXL15_00250, partial [Candidatus Korarchaeota archaeon]